MTAPASRHTVVMVTSSYPRFPGDTVGTFMEPIARGVALRGHDVHVVAPWHPLVARAPVEDGLRFHFYRYSPLRSLNVFGYAQALQADVRLRWSAWATAPAALLAGWLASRRIARRVGATVMHGHWVVPGGATARFAMPRLPLVVSLHGSDVYVAERHVAARLVAAGVLRRAAGITACSEDLRRRAVALGAPEERVEVVPYGVDSGRFRPSDAARAAVRSGLGIDPAEPLVVAVGRFVRKKGFEYLIGAIGRLAARGIRPRLVLAGGGDLERELRAGTERAAIADLVHFPGVLPHDQVAALLAAADVVAVPSVRDPAGNVDGLPNVLLEALAAGAAVVATPAGGIGSAIREGETGLLVPEQDEEALATAIARLLASPERRR
jgi:glycosyltransferase involved in cell wall biosynthesis